MSVRLSTTGSGDASESSFACGDLVPESGLYGFVCHEDVASETAAFIRLQTFPECVLCGARARYRPVQVAPYIFDDPDFAV